MEKATKNNLKSNLKKLTKIAEWFEKQEEIDVEESLGKVKEAAGLIVESKKRLKEIENEFEEIRKWMEE